VISSHPSIDPTTHTVTCAIYVLDIASGSSATAVVLYIYEKNDVIAGGGLDTVCQELLTDPFFGLLYGGQVGENPIRPCRGNG
jgi:hypothetical protein